MHTHPLASPLPVRNSADALHVLSLAIERPLRAETHSFLLDDHGVGGLLVAVSGTHHASTVLEVVEVMAAAGERVEALTGLVVASVRPHGGLESTDEHLWHEASHRARCHGIELIEWFVVGPHGIELPRTLTTESARWPGGV
ncbi:MAG: hypothetical protein RLZ14_448 [Actinomycetota bacterium]